MTLVTIVIHFACFGNGQILIENALHSFCIISIEAKVTAPSGVNNHRVYSIMIMMIQVGKKIIMTEVLTLLGLKELEKTWKKKN